MAGAAQLKLNSQLTVCDPKNTAVTIICQPKHASLLSYSKLSCKLQPTVTEETFSEALKLLQGPDASSGENSCPLFLTKATLAFLPSKCSRHNTPTQAHAISKLVSKHSTGNDECFVIVCERQHVLASACAVARAFPLFSKKSGKGDSADGEKVKSDSVVSVEFLLVDGGNLTQEEVDAASYAMDGVRLTAKIVDTPCADMDVCAFLAEVNKVGQSLGIKPDVIRGEELVTRGLGGIWSVGKAARSPPALAVLSHTPPGATQTIAWVGKGIVYDTGGLSLKSGTFMVGMKRDCGGAAGILGAFYATVKSGFKQNLHAVFCLAENAIGPDATRPDDIVHMYSGKTVEVNNTDAEGRMVLSDGVVFAKKDLGATVILDMATLTGAQGVSTGKYHAAIVTNSSDWEVASSESGRISGDLTFPLPYSPELHFKEFASTVADMKNSVADRANAQSSCAGLFIHSHLGNDYQGDWIHVDMCYPSHSGERATGYGVALLMSMFGRHSNNSYVKGLSPFEEKC